MNSLPTKTALTIRWLARIGSIVSAGLLLAFAFGGNEESVLSARGPEAVGLLFFPLGILVGMALGWRRELWGGLVTLGSLALFYLWHFRASGDFPTGPYFVLFALPGLLFLLAWCLGSCCRTQAPLGDSSA